MRTDTELTTRCSRCIHRTDPDYDCLQHEITATERDGMLYMQSCSGFQPQDRQTEQPATVDENAQPVILQH